MSNKKPCEDPKIRERLKCFDSGKKKCYGHLLFGCKWSSAKPIISLSRCHWDEEARELAR